MHVQREFDPEMAKWLEIIPLEELKALQKRLPVSSFEKPRKQKLSQAELILKSIEDPNCNLDGISEYICASSREFRDNFHFKHDEE